MYFGCDDDRCCKLSLFAEKNKSEFIKKRNNFIFCNWRLRAPRVEQTSSACVTEKGFIASGGDYVSSREEYIRPAVWVTFRQIH